SLAALLTASGGAVLLGGCGGPSPVPTSAQVARDPLAALDAAHWDARSAEELRALPLQGAAEELETWADLGAEDSAVDTAREQLTGFLGAAYLDPSALRGLSDQDALDHVSSATPESGGTRCTRRGAAGIAPSTRSPSRSRSAASAARRSAPTGSAPRGTAARPSRWAPPSPGPRSTPAPGPSACSPVAWASSSTSTRREASRPGPCGSRSTAWTAARWVSTRGCWCPRSPTTTG